MIEQYINQIIANFDPYKNGRWCYEDGILMNAIYNMYKITNKSSYRDFVINYYNTLIKSDGTITSYSIEEYNIDNIAPGIALFDVYYDTKEEKYLKAIHNLYKQLENHPRTSEGNFWHKNKYPFQVWLDGIYMGLVFYTKYLKMTNQENLFSDIKSQLKNVRKYLYDDKRQLYVHAYDERKVMNWADKLSGKSPNVWSRSLGWLAMALVDILEIQQDQDINTMYIEMIEGVEIHKYHNMWMQIVDKPKLKGNYYETSGTMMICYSYLKATRLGLVDKKYADIGREIFKETLSRYFFEDEEGYHLGGICKVAGLDNENRDGSDDYYLSEEIKNDEVKGVAPFILAYSELKLLD